MVIICRWGCVKEIVTDNASVYRAAVNWLEQKYGIRGIRISYYNSKANGKIERPHWDVHQMLWKATGGVPSNGFGFSTMYYGQIELLLGKIMAVHLSS